MSEKERDWFFTFGCGQQYANMYVKIRGTFSTARQNMFDLVGDRWAFQYDEDEFPAIAERWNWKEITPEQIRRDKEAACQDS